jgi:hypothetical protein
VKPEALMIGAQRAVSAAMKLGVSSVTELMRLAYDRRA